MTRVEVKRFVSNFVLILMVYETLVVPISSTIVTISMGSSQFSVLR